MEPPRALLSLATDARAGETSPIVKVPSRAAAAARLGRYVWGAAAPAEQRIGRLDSFISRATRVRRIRLLSPLLVLSGAVAVLVWVLIVRTHVADAASVRQGGEPHRLVHRPLGGESWTPPYVKTERRRAAPQGSAVLGGNGRRVHVQPEDGEQTRR